MSKLPAPHVGRHKNCAPTGFSCGHRGHFIRRLPTATTDGGPGRSAETGYCPRMSRQRPLCDNACSNTAAAQSGASLRPHGNFDEFVARTHADSKIDRSRAAGRHRSTVGSRLGEGAHRNVLHGAVRHARDEQDVGDHHGLARRVQEAHGVRIAPSPRYRPAHELGAMRAHELRRRGFRRRRLRRQRAGDLVGRCRSTRTRSGRGAESGSAAARALAGSGFRPGTGLIGWSASAGGGCWSLGGGWSFWT